MEMERSKSATCARFVLAALGESNSRHSEFRLQVLSCLLREQVVSEDVPKAARAECLDALLSVERQLHANESEEKEEPEVNIKQSQVRQPFKKPAPLDPPPVEVVYSETTVSATMPPAGEPGTPPAADVDPVEVPEEDEDEEAGRLEAAHDFGHHFSVDVDGCRWKRVWRARHAEEENRRAMLAATGPRKPQAAGWRLRAAAGVTLRSSRSFPVPKARNLQQELEGFLLDR